MIDQKTYKLRRCRARVDVRALSLRRGVFSRDNNTCQRCGTKDVSVIRHVNPVIYGGTTTLDNLITLCKTCNAKSPLK